MTYKWLKDMDENIYMLDLEFMLNNIYNIKIIDMMELCKKRMDQYEFMKKILFKI